MMIAASLLSFSIPAFADAPVTVTGIADTTPISVSVKKKHVPFAQKHPRLHNFERKMRKKVQLWGEKLAPWFAIFGGAAQIATFFKI